MRACLGFLHLSGTLAVVASLLACAGLAPSPDPLPAEAAVSPREEPRLAKEATVVTSTPQAQQAEPEVPVVGEVIGRFPKPATTVLFQDVNGLFDEDGVYLGPYGGRNDIRDILVVDARQSTFFLWSSSDDTVRVVHREGDELVVRRLLEHARVVHPMGRVALVRGTGEDKARIIDAAGRVIHQGLEPVSSMGLAVPVTEPEYWWLRSSFFDLPTPVCTSRGIDGRCGWLQPDGSWFADKNYFLVTTFETGWAMASRNGELWVNAAGEPFFAASVTSDWSWSGKATDDGLLIVGIVSRTESEGNSWPRETWRYEVVARDGGRFPITADLLHETERYHCAYGNAECRYRFHEQRAAVWVYGPAGVQSAYLGPDGKIVIGPSPCAHPNPSGPFRDDRAFHCDGDNYWMIDRSGQRIAGPYPGWVGNPLDRSPNTYAMGLFFSDGLAAVPVEGGWGYVDRTGRLVHPGPYNIARPFRHGIALVTQGDDVRFIRKDGSRMFEVP